MRHLFLAFLLGGCSHIPLDDARWIATNATHIDQVRDRLGNPERQVYGRGWEESQYIDNGMHMLLLCAIPGVNLIFIIPALVETVAFQHERYLIVRFNPQTGEIVEISQADPRTILGHETDISKY